MDVAAFVVSLFALAVASVSAYYARRQARINEDRRREERSPRYTAEIEDAGGWYRLWLRLESSESIEGLTASVVDDRAGVSFTHGQNGVDPSLSSRRLEARHGRVTAGQAAAWRLDLDDAHTRKVWLRVDSEGTQAQDRWTQTILAEVPAEIVLRHT
jgi:hypothetical protein